MTVPTGVVRRTDPMRVVITGAGSVGRSIARELIQNGHNVLLVDRAAEVVQRSRSTAPSG